MSPLRTGVGFLLRFISIFCLLPLLHAAELLPVATRQVPAKQQLAWHTLEFYGMIHFGLNTYTDKEWGYGDVSADIFNPTHFDADKIVETMKEAGMKGVVLVCKHHDGFCLWPSKFTDYSVKKSPWRNGQGDMVKEVSDACRKQGMKFGVYLSPWDRNCKEYGKPEYVNFYRNQLTELLTNYGEVFIAWFDGAQGGDGYYGGAKEVRKVDNRSYYKWPETWSLVRRLQTNAVIFSDAGPDVRWVGNESGLANDPCWNTIDLKDCYPGMPNFQQLATGLRNGPNWVPAECNVSVRPWWFYHAKDDLLVKSSKQLVDIYYRTVGRGACLNLNISPDTRGLIPDRDSAALLGMRKWLDATFATNLFKGAKVAASNVRAGDETCAPENLLDDNLETYWSTDESSTSSELILEIHNPVRFNVIRVREYLPLGQRVEQFAVDTWQADQWKECFRRQSLGNQRLVRLREPISTKKLRLRILKCSAPPAISEISVFAEPSGMDLK